jgi:hypothetical protein
MSIRTSLPAQLIKRATKLRKIKGREKVAELHRLTPISADAVDLSRPVQLVLHVGVHKTGSTSIQVALTRSYRTLLGAGVLYPSGIFPDRQHSLLRALVTKGSPEDVTRFFLSLRRLANTNSCKTVILSGEAVSLLEAPQLETVRAALETAKFDTKVVILIRPELSLLRSSLSQWMISYPHFVTPFALFKGRKGYSAEAIARTFSEVFGRERIVRCNLAPGDDAVEIFARIAGIDLPGDTRRNASLDFAVMSFINAIKADFEIAPVSIHAAAKSAFGVHRTHFTNEDRFFEELLLHMGDEAGHGTVRPESSDAGSRLTLEEQVAYLEQFEKFIRHLRKDHAWSMKGWVRGRDERQKRALALLLKKDGQGRD